MQITTSHSAKVGSSRQGTATFVIHSVAQAGRLPRLAGQRPSLAPGESHIRLLCLSPSAAPCPIPPCCCARPQVQHARRCSSHSPTPRTRRRRRRRRRSTRRSPRRRGGRPRRPARRRRSSEGSDERRRGDDRVFRNDISKRDPKREPECLALSARSSPRSRPECSEPIVPNTTPRTSLSDSLFASPRPRARDDATEKVTSQK